MHRNRCTKVGEKREKKMEIKNQHSFTMEDNFCKQQKVINHFFAFEIQEKEEKNKVVGVVNLVFLF